MLSKIGGTHLNADITLLKKDPFAPDINEIYCVMYGNELYKFKVFMRQIEYEKQEPISKKNMINRFDKSDQKIVNYAIISVDFLVILYASKITLIRVST